MPVEGKKTGKESEDKAKEAEVRGMRPLTLEEISILANHTHQSRSCLRIPL